MATHSSVLAFRILWTEDPGGGRGCAMDDRVAKSQTWLKWLNMHAHVFIYFIIYWVPGLSCNMQSHLQSLLRHKIFFLVAACEILWNLLIVLCGPLSCSMWDLVSWLGIEPGPPILEVQSLSHWTTREVLRMLQVKATLGRSAGKGDSSERHRAAGLCCSTQRMISSWAGAVLGYDLVLEVSGSSVLQLPGCWSPGQW